MPLAEPLHTRSTLTHPEGESGSSSWLGAGGEWMGGSVGPAAPVGHPLGS